MSISDRTVFSGKSKYWYVIKIETYIKGMNIIMGDMVKCRITLGLIWEKISTIFNLGLINIMSVPKDNPKKIHL